MTSFILKMKKEMLQKRYVLFSQFLLRRFHYLLFGAADGIQDLTYAGQVLE